MTTLRETTPNSDFDPIRIGPPERDHLIIDPGLAQMILKAADHHDLVSAGNETYRLIFKRVQEIREEFIVLNRCLDESQAECTRLNERYMVLWMANNLLVDRVLVGLGDSRVSVDVCGEPDICEAFHIHDTIPSSDPLEQGELYA